MKYLGSLDSVDSSSTKQLCSTILILSLCPVSASPSPLADAAAAGEIAYRVSMRTQLYFNFQLKEAIDWVTCGDLA